MRHEGIWHIVAPGPSLDWNAWEITEDPVCCINMALWGAHQCDYWVCCDRPNSIHDKCKYDAKRLKPKVVTKQKRFPFYEEKFGLECLNGYKITDGHWVHEVKKTHLTFSMILAIAWACIHGATALHFTGVDMQGRGYFKSNPKEKHLKGDKPKDLEPHERRWAKRWRSHEGIPVRNILREAKRRGIGLVGLPSHVVSQLAEEGVGK